MARTSIKIFEALAKEPVKGFDRIRLEVSYDKGGWNGSARGYSMTAFPAKVEEPGVTTIGLFAGSSAFLEGAARFSSKRLKELADMLATGGDAVASFVEKNAGKNGMALTGERVYPKEANT